MAAPPAAAAGAPPAMVPVAFDGCSGWFHAPAEATASGRGVVLCPPFGQDAVCTGRGWRALADTLAAAGLPALRFDYPGTGDSAGDEAPGNLDAWISSVRAAADWLRARPGVREVALCGFRLGADLAAAAAAGRPRETPALALLAPVGSGRAWLRQLMLGSGAGPAPSADWLETAGFRLHNSDLDAAARRLDLGSALLGADAPRVLVMASSRLPGPEPCARLRDAGTALEQRGFDGLGEFLRDAHLSVVPRAAFTEVARWLRDGAPPPAAAAHDRDAERRGLAEPAVLALDGGVEERLLRFGPANGLAGVLCEPPPERLAAGAPAVLILNTGANGRAGNGRMAVRLARRLAAAGVASLRMDATGIGDGGPAGDLAGAEDGPPDTYHPKLVRDAVSALDLLESRGHAGAVVAGVCSGAHAAFQAAVGDARVRGLVLANLPAFDRDAGGAPALDGGPPPGEHLALRRPRMLVRRLAAESDRVAAARLGLELGLDRAGRWMRAILSRRVEVVLAYSAGDRGLRELRAHFGRRGRRLSGSGQVRCVVLGGTDHSLLPRAMQEEFIALVEEQALRLREAPARPFRAASPAERGGARRRGAEPATAALAGVFGALLRRPSPPPPQHHAG